MKMKTYYVLRRHIDVYSLVVSDVDISSMCFSGSTGDSRLFQDSISGRLGDGHNSSIGACRALQC